MLSTFMLMILLPNSFQGSRSTKGMVTDVSHLDSMMTSIVDPGREPGLEWSWKRCVSLLPLRHLIVVCTQTCIFRCRVCNKVVACLLYEMLYPCKL